MQEQQAANESGDVGVQVEVSKRAVHQAVRNILSNEMGLDIPTTKDEIRNQAFALIKTEVMNYLSGVGYGKADLQAWATRVMETRMKDIDKILKEVVRELVYKQISEEIAHVTEAIVKTGMEVRIGWNQKVKVSLQQEPK